jgi:hypothetical protein
MLSKGYYSKYDYIIDMQITVSVAADYFLDYRSAVSVYTLYSLKMWDDR